MGEKIADYWPVLFRAGLYFLLGLLPELGVHLKEIAEGKFQPSGWMLAWMGVSALYAGLVPVRAYFDGSAQRHADARNGNGHPPPPK